MNIALLNSYLEMVAYIVTILGLPLAVFLFYIEKVKERREREYGTYNALDDKYIHFLEICLDRPDLDVFDVPLDSEADAESVRKKRQAQIVFLILISILERAYLMYNDQSTRIKSQQWIGWVEYMKDYCMRPNFRREWPELGPQFDKKFVAFMERLLQETSVDDGQPIHAEG